MNNTNFSLLTMGEMLLRYSPMGEERLNEGTSLHKCVGGAELNVATGVAQLGLQTGIISKLPQNLLGEYVQKTIRTMGVSDDTLVFDTTDAARMGIYYFEGGRAPRKPRVIYDRKYSSFTTFSIDELNLDTLPVPTCFHVSGISLAVGDAPRQTAIALMRHFKEKGALISFDVNYRAALWTEDEARETILPLLPDVDILFISEETSRLMMKKQGTLKEIQRSFAEEYGLSYVISTRRTVVNPHCHHFGSSIYEHQTNRWYDQADYQNIEVLDRIGSGDAFVAGVLYGLLGPKSAADAVSYGNAMAAVKCTIAGDLIKTDRKEIDSIIAAHTTNAHTPEMSR